ncbi:hypothetical protein BH24ACT8_BH24ACT8_01780 [soil metagenome]|jgi:hypothetical protein
MGASRGGPPGTLALYGDAMQRPPVYLGRDEVELAFGTILGATVAALGRRDHTGGRVQ